MQLFGTNPPSQLNALQTTLIKQISFSHKNSITMEEAKEINEQAYDHIADWYLDWATNQTSPRERYTEKVLANITASSTSSSSSSSPHLLNAKAPRILELGCGAGVPISRMLLDRGAHVVGNDISTKQIEMAKARCPDPQATFLAGDMAALTFEPASFDGVVGFYSVFHLPRDEQKVLLRKIHGWLKPGGMVALNLATVDEEEIHGEMMGHGMFWSSFGVEGNTAMVAEAGFEAVEVEVLEAGDGKLSEDDPDYGVKFMWISAKKGVDG